LPTYYSKSTSFTTIKNISTSKPNNFKALVVEKVLGTKKTGTSYLKVTFADETGSIQGFMWDHAKRYQNIVEVNKISFFDTPPKKHDCKLA